MKQNTLLAALIVAIIIVTGLIIISPDKSIPEVSSEPAATTKSSSSEKLKTEDIKVGEGREVKSGDTVVIHYKGTLTNGEQFDSSYDRGQPFETKIGVGSVIKGWDEGVPGMKIGGKRKLTIPSDMAYGEQGQGSIPPNSTLIFEVELVDIK